MKYKTLKQNYLIILGIVGLGFSMSGCGPSNILLLIILIFTVINTAILTVSLIAFLVWYFTKNKNKNGS